MPKALGILKIPPSGEGNVCLAAHNRGANSYFGQIHTLNIGDKITLTTKLGTRTYHVTDVSKVSETDRGGLADSGENMLTLLHLRPQPAGPALVRHRSGDLIFLRFAGSVLFDFCPSLVIW